jgi:hypothetical protein
MEALAGRVAPVGLEQPPRQRGGGGASRRRLRALGVALGVAGGIRVLDAPAAARGAGAAAAATAAAQDWPVVLEQKLDRGMSGQI